VNVDIVKPFETSPIELDGMLEYDFCVRNDESYRGEIESDLMNL
jgi:hypothetical protein